MPPGRNSFSHQDAKPRPHGRVVLQALCELAPVTGPLVAHDDQCDHFVAIHPGQQPDDFGSD
jgi:hypothetical protein